MKLDLKSVAWIFLLGVIGCQPTGPATQGPATQGPDQTRLKQAEPAIGVPDLPTALSDSYLSAFADAPDATARRFLDAYDDFTESGSVTRQRVVDHAHLQAAIERGRFLSHVLAMDLDGDMEITFAEVDAAISLPGWTTRPVSIEGVFASDHNQDGLITLPEAVHYSRVLYSRSAAAALRPIESYLMLSDLNGDDIVTRDELEVHLYRRLTGAEPKVTELRGGSDGALR